MYCFFLKKNLVMWGGLTLFLWPINIAHLGLIENTIIIINYYYYIVLKQF